MVRGITLSVVIPCYNEADTVERVVEAVRAAPVEEIEIIFVDDASTDGTLEQIDKLEHQIDTVIRHERNRGKGAAVRSGFAAATGDVVLIQDADLEYDPADYEKLLLPFLENQADVVFGSRFAGGERHRVLYYWHSVGNRLLTMLSNMATNLNLTDMEVCYKAFRRELIQGIELKEEGFGFEVEVTAKLARRDLRIYEVGVSYAGRTYSQGKKISWRDGFWALWCIFKYNLLRR